MTTLTNSQNEQLFTDLTPEEAAIIAGGVNLWLGTIKALRGTDQHEFRPDNTEEVYIQTSKGTRLWSGGLNVGNKGKYINKSIRGITSRFFSVFDYDNPNSGRGGNDFIGALSLKKRKGKYNATLFSTKNSIYKLSYRIY